ncbi:MAG: hypothetical protein AAGI88_04740 [Pseudomonadota bacterium]
MNELLLHIGQSKCASSTIQAFLSRNPIFETDKRYVYYCLLPERRYLCGNEVRAHIENSHEPYLNSVIDFAAPNDFFKALEDIKRLGRNESVIVSNEGLGNFWLDNEKIARLESREVPIKVFMLGRPPREWLKASWWAWGFWLAVSVSEWIQRIGPTINYCDRLAPWYANRNVQSVFVADVSQGPIDRFREFLGLLPLTDESGFIANTATSADLLRFLIKNKAALNRTIHNPSIEFILNREIDPSGGGAPFVLTRPMIEEAVLESRGAHKQLLATMQWIDGYRPPELESQYLDPGAYSECIEDFNLDEFLAEKPSETFLKQMNEWLLNRLEKSPLLFRPFDPESYLALNTDVEAARANPYEHYLRYGIYEGRSF